MWISRCAPGRQPPNKCPRRCAGQCSDYYFLWFILCKEINHIKNIYHQYLFQLSFHIWYTSTNIISTWIVENMKSCKSRWSLSTDVNLTYFTFKCNYMFQNCFILTWFTNINHYIYLQDEWVVFAICCFYLFIFKSCLYLIG